MAAARLHRLRRHHTNPFGWWLLALFCLFLGLLPWLMPPTLVNLAPLARVNYNGDPYFVNPAAVAFQSGVEVIHDGLTYEQDNFHLPDADRTRTIELTFPCALPIEQVCLLGIGQQADTVSVQLALQQTDATWVVYEPLDYGTQPGLPPIIYWEELPLTQKMKFRFSDGGAVWVDEIACFAILPRGLAWLLFLIGALLAPWLFGLFFGLFLLGTGRLLCRAGRLLRPSQADASSAVSPNLLDLECRWLVGLVGATFLSICWWLLPRLDSIQWGWWIGSAGLAFAELYGLCRKTPAVRSKPPSEPISSETESLPNEQQVERRWWLAVVWLSLLLLTHVQVEGYLVGRHRVEPLDHRLPLLGARYLVQQQLPHQELSRRPWLLHILFVPWLYQTNPAEYLAYCGFMSWLNATALLAAYRWWHRWQLPTIWPKIGWLMVLPLLPIYHFIGPRPLAAALALLALAHWLPQSSQESSRPLSVGPVESIAPAWWGGLAMLLGILVHPGALFLLPGYCLYGCWQSWRTGRWLDLLAQLFLPAVGFISWSLLMQTLYPNQRNDLLFYPILLDQGQPFPPEWNLWQMLSSLRWEDWRQLFWHRLLHLRHYLVTDAFLPYDQVQPWITWWRWASVPNLLSIVLSGRLLWLTWWTPAQRLFLALAVVGPLVTQHLHIGQAHPQWHISALPFFALTLLVLANTPTSSGPPIPNQPVADLQGNPQNNASASVQSNAIPRRSGRSAWFGYLLWWECALRVCYPVLLAWIYTAGRGISPFNLCAPFGNDILSYGMLATALPVVWLVVDRLRRHWQSNT